MWYSCLANTDPLVDHKQGQTTIPASANDTLERTSKLVFVHGFRVFSAEPNYYCLEGACAALMTEIAFVKASY